MAYIMTTEAEILQKMGKNANVTDFDTTAMTAANLRAESTINVMARFDYSALVTAGLGSSVKGLLSDIASSLVAIEGIAYDMSGFTSRIEAEDMINVLRDGALRGLAILRDKKNQDFVKEHAT